MRRLRHDLNYGISAGLLVASVATIATGVVVHLWDLHGFVYHTYAGYAMTGLALVHVAFNWHRMVGYARHRLRRRARAKSSPSGRPAVPSPGLAPLSRASVTRRTFVGLAIGSGGGYLLGRGLRPPPPIERGADLGVVYHQWSKPGVIDALGSVASWGQQPELYKTYTGSLRVALPPPDRATGIAVEDALARRRSTRAYAAEPLTLPELSRLLLLSAGITGERYGNRLRAAPSSGALYPIEVYPVIHHVAGLEPGVYHYGVAGHDLALLRGGDFRAEVVRQGIAQEFLGQAGVVFFMTVMFQRMRWKYHDRTYRYGLIEAGHIGQNLYLAATSMGLGACSVGAFMDDAINAMLGVDGHEEAAIYMLAVGKV